MLMAGRFSASWRRPWPCLCAWPPETVPWRPPHPLPLRHPMIHGGIIRSSCGSRTRPSKTLPSRNWESRPATSSPSASTCPLPTILPSGAIDRRLGARFDCQQPALVCRQPCDRFLLALSHAGLNSRVSERAQTLRERSRRSGGVKNKKFFFFYIYIIFYIKKIFFLYFFFIYIYFFFFYHIYIYIYIYYIYI